MSGSTFKREDPTYLSKMPTFFLVWLVWERQIVGVLGPETGNEFQAISGGLKHFEAMRWLVGLPVPQCMCPLLRNWAQIRDVLSSSILLFLGYWSSWVRSNWCSALLAWNKFCEDRAILVGGWGSTHREDGWLLDTFSSHMSIHLLHLLANWLPRNLTFLDLFSSYVAIPCMMMYLTLDAENIPRLSGRPPALPWDEEVLYDRRGARFGPLGWQLLLVPCWFREAVDLGRLFCFSINSVCLRLVMILLVFGISRYFLRFMKNLLL